MTKRGLSSTTARNAHPILSTSLSTSLSTVLSAEVSRRLVDWNPATAIERPKAAVVKNARDHCANKYCYCSGERRASSSQVVAVSADRMPGRRGARPYDRSCRLDARKRNSRPRQATSTPPLGVRNRLGGSEHKEGCVRPTARRGRPRPASRWKRLPVHSCSHAQKTASSNGRVPLASRCSRWSPPPCGSAHRTQSAWPHVHIARKYSAARR